MYLVKLTLASGMGGSFDFSVVAAFSYSGASFLQWPHLQKKKRHMMSKDLPLEVISDNFLNSASSFYSRV